MISVTARAFANLPSLHVQQLKSIELTARLVLAANLALADVLFPHADRFYEKLSYKKMIFYCTKRPK
jgi:hypothetical protein